VFEYDLRNLAKGRKERMRRGLDYFVRTLIATMAVIAIFSGLPGCQPPEKAVKEPPVAEQPAKERPAEFEVGPLALTPSTVMADDSVAVTTNIRNIGDVAGTYTAVLTMDGREIDRNDIWVIPEQSEELVFQVPTATAGSYKLTIGESSAVMTVHDWTPYAIQYDKGQFGGLGIFVMGEFGHIVRFTPLARPFKIQKVKICGTAEVEKTPDLDTRRFTVRIWNKDSSQLLWSQDFPWRLFYQLYNWVEISVPDIRVDDDFQVEVVTRSEASYLGGPSGHKIIANDIALAYDDLHGMVETAEVRSQIAEERSGVSYMGKRQEAGGVGKNKVWHIRVHGVGAPL
jgi:hypothetical protein